MDFVELRRARMVGITILAIAVAAIALLFAGQGPVVAAGAVVGVILGAVAGMFSLLWLRGGAGRSISFDTQPLYADVAPDEALIAQMRDTSEVMGMDLGPVEAVRPVVFTAESGGMALQLIAIERRTAGATLRFEGRGSVGVHAPMGMPVMSVTDDIGTAYRVASEGMGGGHLRIRFDATMAPPPAAGARQLTVNVQRFLDFDPRSRKSSEGPWVFEVPLTE